MHEGGGLMAYFLLYLAGIVTGYLFWRYATAPQLLDAENEADYWKSQWLKLKSSDDADD